MFYLLYGDSRQSRPRYEELIKKLSEDGRLTVYRINSLDFEAGRFKELLQSQPLFEAGQVIACNGLLENPEARALIEEEMEKLARSAASFVFLEESLTKPLLGQFKKLAEKVYQFESPAKTESRQKEYNIYLLTDALGERNRKKMWLELQNAILAGFAPEEIFWKLVWQARNLVLAKKTHSAQEAGVSAYPYRKAKGYLKNFAGSETEKLLTDLVRLYHDSRRGIVDLDTGLELLVLSA